MMNATMIGILLQWPNCYSCLQHPHFSILIHLVYHHQLYFLWLPTILLFPNLSWFLYECTKGSSWHYFMLFSQICPYFLLAFSINYLRPILSSLITAENDSTHFVLLLVLPLITYVINCSLIQAPIKPLTIEFWNVA